MRGTMAFETDMPPVKAPTNLPALVKATFDKAKANGDVNFYPTQVAVLTPATSTPVSFILFLTPCLSRRKIKAGPAASRLM